jgi:hypothetical protein
MNKHTAVCPNGQIIKRNSANRSYSHVAVIFNVNQSKWDVLGWSSKKELAVRNCESQKSYIAKLIKMNCYTGSHGMNPECVVLETICA